MNAGLWIKQILDGSVSGLKNYWYMFPLVMSLWVGLTYCVPLEFRFEWNLKITQSADVQETAENPLESSSR